MKTLSWKNTMTILISLTVLIACGGTGKENDTREKKFFDTGYVDFNIREPENFTYMPTDSVFWYAQLENTEEFGVAGLYLLEGEPKQLFSPWITIGYFSEKLPTCSSYDSILWSYQNNVYPWGELIGEYQVETYSGEEAQAFEMYVPQAVGDSLTKSAKTLTMAFVRQGNHWINFQFVAHEPAKYDQYLPEFKDLVATYDTK